MEAYCGSHIGGHMKYWLMKSEPNAYSIDDLQRDKKTHWDGVRNYQARNFMREMSVGDGVLFYHSNCKVPGIIGLATVSKLAYPDHTAFDPDDHHFDPKSDPENPRWDMVDIKFAAKFDEVLSLHELRADPRLNEMLILRKGNRLSVTPVSAKDWKAICKLADCVVLA